MISFEHSGSFKNLESFLQKNRKFNIRQALESAGAEGVSALSAATPVDSRLAASSWSYRIEATHTGVSVVWYNLDTENGFPVAIMLQYGYATGTGGYVAGRDYINPAMKPIFDKISADVRKAVSNG